MKKGTRRLVFHGVSLSFEGTCRSTRTKQQPPLRVPRSSPAARVHCVCIQQGLKGEPTDVSPVREGFSLRLSPNTHVIPVASHGCRTAELSPPPAEKQLHPPSQTPPQPPEANATCQCSQTHCKFPPPGQPPTPTSPRRNFHRELNKPKKHHGFFFCSFPIVSLY